MSFIQLFDCKSTSSEIAYKSEFLNLLHISRFILHVGQKAIDVGRAFWSFLVVCLTHETICSSRIRPKNPTGCLHVAPTCFTYRKRYVEIGRHFHPKSRGPFRGSKVLFTGSKNLGIFLPKIQKINKIQTKKKIQYTFVFWLFLMRDVVLKSLKGLT